MIIVIKESPSSASCRELFTQLDPNCLEYAHQEKSDEELLALEPDTFVLYHEKAVMHCKALRAKAKPNLRILVILESSSANSTVLARIAGADSCLIAPLAKETLIHAVGNEYAASVRWKNAEQTVAAGTTIHDRYLLTSVLGIGLRSTVYLATDKKTGKTVSIKLLRNMLLKQRDLLGEFMMEAEKLSQFHSPFMVDLLEFGTWQKAPFLVLDIGKAENLYKVLSYRKFNEVEIEKLALDIIRAMIALKHFKVLHMDIKPENILFADGKFYLSEFGLLSPVHAPLDNTCFHYWGDAAYASPEFFSPTAVLCARSDVYSLGVLLYTIACRKNPFAGYYHREIEKRHYQKDAIRAQNAIPTYCSAFKITLDAMLQMQAQSRPRLRELELILSQSIAIHSGQKLQMEDPGSVPLFTDKKSGAASSSSQETNTDTAAGDSALLKIRKNQLDQTIPIEIQKRMGREKIRNRCAAAILLILCIIGISMIMYSWGKAKRPPIYFNQGKRIMFTCYNAHTHPIRTLDFRTVLCPQCKELTSPSYTCRKCYRIFGTSLWPLRDMTEKECETFEKKTLHCPFCKSLDIYPTKVPKIKKRLPPPPKQPAKLTKQQLQKQLNKK